jgi:hypothetical protein
MDEIRRPLSRPFFLATLLASIHAAVVIFIVTGVYRSTDPEAAMAFALFDYLDYPVFPLFSQTGGLVRFAASLLITGGALWFCYGFVLQSLIFVRRTGGLIRLGIGVALLGLLWSIPEISLRMKPPWEQQWDRAWAIGRGQGADSGKAIRYVSEAIRLSPGDNDKLGTLWDYLGSLYMDQKDYSHAESAFKSRLALAQAQPNPKPQDLLEAYTALDSVYYWSGKIQDRKECLPKVIALFRIIHGGDSAQEANSWESLANITHDSGDSKDAQVMLERAIKMYSDLNDQTAPLDYLKRKLQGWKNE